MERKYQYDNLNQLSYALVNHINAGFTTDPNDRQSDNDVLQALSGERVDRPSCPLRVLGHALKRLAKGGVVLLTVDYDSKQLQLSTPELASVTAVPFG